MNATLLDRKDAAIRQIEPSEAMELKTGDVIAIGIRSGCKIELIPAKITREAFYNSDSDEPDFEIETTNGYSDLYSLYRIT